MQAIILATDETRWLAPLTDSIPGPLLPIVNRPVMASALEILARADCKRVLVSVCNRNAPIAAYFGDGKRWGVEIAYVTQRERWGSGGALKWTATLLNETFLVLPGDAVIDLDIEMALAYHRAHGGVATAILHRSRDDHHAPAVQMSADGRITGSSESAELALTGAFIFEPKVLSHIPFRSQFDLSNDLIRALIAAGESVFGHDMTGYWNPLRTLASYHEAQQVFLYSAYRQCVPQTPEGEFLAQVRFPSLTARQIAPGIWVGINHLIHPSAKLAPPVYIGPNSWIGRDVELGAGTVIGSDVVIDEEATVSGSTVLSETYIGRLVNVQGRIVNAATLMDPATGDCMQVSDPFLLSQATTPQRLSRPFSRAWNTLVAGVLLIGMAPLMVVLWLWISVFSGGRPFVRTKCVGERLKTLDGHEHFYLFDQIRFRTSTKHGRYILCGRGIEHWELHRLPELINVLRGDMALVGVKPLTIEQAALLTEDWQERRHTVPAGFTGLWYLQPQSTSDLDTILVADVYYATMRSWHGDIDIVMKTVSKWFQQHSSHDGETFSHAETQTSISSSETG